MKRFERRRGVITTALSPAEVDLLDSLIGQLVELLDESESAAEPAGSVDEAADADDPFAFWARDLQVDPDEPELPEDPVLHRLFPTAYPHDPQASSDFRRFTVRDMRAAKIASARVVRGDLAATERGARPLTIEDSGVDAWLKTLTALRLSLATRLGIDDAESAEALSALPDDDPRAFVMSVYDWLGFAQETLVESL